MRLRPATGSDVSACAAIWRDALNDYMGRLNQPELPEELAPIRRLHRHLHATDPERFCVATRDGRGEGSEPIGFGAAVRRDDVWFLSMLFVRPGDQGRGIGRAILGRILPPPDDGAALAAGTDSAQPVSNALYASLGVVPRMPLLSLIGTAAKRDVLGDLPSGIRPRSIESVDGADVDTLDRDLAGFAHPQDHAFLRAEGRRGFLYEGPDGRVAGYGYTSEVGRIGPVAVLDGALMAPVIGHLLDAVPPRGASAVWAPGDAGLAVEALLRAGLRLDGFPVLLCWSRPFADFSRFLPMSPGLL